MYICIYMSRCIYSYMYICICMYVWGSDRSERLLMFRVCSSQEHAMNWTLLTAVLGPSRSLESPTLSQRLEGCELSAESFHVHPSSPAAARRMAIRRADASHFPWLCGSCSLKTVQAWACHREVQFSNPGRLGLSTSRYPWGRVGGSTSFLSRPTQYIMR